MKNFESAPQSSESPKDSTNQSENQFETEAQLQLDLMAEYYEQQMNARGQTVEVEHLTTQEQNEAARLWIEDGLAKAFRLALDSEEGDETVSLDKVKEEL